MRADKALKDVPVIFLTGRGDVESRVKGFAAGGQDYVAKPFSQEELLARVRVHLSQRTRLDRLRREKHLLEARARLRENLSDMIVHDLRAPLGTIQATLQVLQEGGALGEERARPLLANSRRAAEFLLLMVNDLLDVGAGRVRTAAAPLDARALRERLASLFEPLCSPARVRLSFEGPDGPAPSTDPVLVFRILANLIHNAVKFSPSGGSITVRSKVRGGVLRFEVDDEGPGVPDEEKGRIFEKYYRAKGAAARSAPGTGLGLAFCRLAARGLGARVAVEDRPGGGSRFSLELPLSAALTRAPRRRAGERGSSSRRTAGSS